MKVSAAALTEERSAKSSGKKMPLLPVASRKSSIASRALVSLRHAKYTLALCDNNALGSFQNKALQKNGKMQSHLCRLFAYARICTGDDHHFPI